MCQEVDDYNVLLYFIVTCFMYLVTDNRKSLWHITNCGNCLFYIYSERDVYGKNIATNTDFESSPIDFPRNI